MPVADPEMVLETPRLRLEPLVPAHAAALYEPLRDPRLYTFIPQDPPATVHSLESRYLALSTRRSPDGREVWLNWALRRRDSAAYVGTVQATVYADRTAALAYMISVPFWRQGYAKEGCTCVLQYLHRTYHVTRAVAVLDTRNTASMRLVESLGFVRVATHLNADFFKGSPSDEYRYEWSAPPSGPPW